MDSTVQPLDDRIVRNIVKPPVKPLDHDLLFPNGEDSAPAWEILRDYFKAEGKITKEDAITIIHQAKRLLHAEPNILKVDYPVNVVGDIHGQYYDLLTVLNSAGSPAEMQYLFLGDYVDRGSFSVEVMLLLYAIKINYPWTFHLLRGNHECRQLTSHFNFRMECEHKYDREVYEHFVDSFNSMPLCAIINDKFFALHGGISPDLRSISDIELLNRYQEPPTYGLMCDLLWSDPYSEAEERGIYKSGNNSLISSFELSVKESRDAASQQHSNKLSCLPSPKRGPQFSVKLQDINHFRPNELRGCSYTFGGDAIQQFLTNNKMLCIIRAHEAQLEGYKMQYNNPETGFPGVITVFSAPNYCDVHQNKGAILKLSKGSLRVQQFKWSRHPYYLPNFMDIFTWSVPFVSEKVLEMLKVLLGEGHQENVDDVELPQPVVNFIWGKPGDENEVGEPQETRETPAWLLNRGNAIRNKVKSIGRILKLYDALKMRNDVLRNLQDGFTESEEPLEVDDDENQKEKQTLDSFRCAQEADIVNERRP